MKASDLRQLLWHIRTSKRMTQADFARLFGCSFAAYRNWEQGKNLRQFAKFLEGFERCGYKVTIRKTATNMAHED